MEDDNGANRRLAVDLNNEVWSYLDAGHISAQAQEREPWFGRRDEPSVD